MVAISAGVLHTIALKGDGSVWEWGRNVTLGDVRSTPVQVIGLTGVVAISAGSSPTVALKGDGSVRAWGASYFGQVGDGTTGNIRYVPVQVIGLTGVVAISAGSNHTVALKGDGNVWAWGDNTFGQLGDGAPPARSTPVQVSGLTGAIAISAGNIHTVALKGDGSVWAWGNNGNGQFGDGTTTNRSTPVLVSGLTGVVAISAGVLHTIALKDDGSVWAWGDNYYGELGDPTTTYRSTPVQVSGLTGVVAISAGFRHTVALKGDGSVLAWGDNSDGRIGDGTLAQRLSPTLVVNPSVDGFLNLNTDSDSVTLPSAPTIGTATAGNTSISVAFTPGTIGSGTLTNYEATCSVAGGGAGTPVSGGSSPIVVSGLANGTAYLCNVRTNTSDGTSSWSANSNSVTPSASVAAIAGVGATPAR